MQGRPQVIHKYSFYTITTEFCQKIVLSAGV